jgi:uncharacterized protein YdhG (YjbR/CyaY superfamily)
MTAAEIDEYLAGIGEPQRSTVETMRALILELVPDAEQTLSYGAPAFKLGGKAVAGIAAYKNHVSYLPHSGAVVDALGDRLAGYRTSKGAVHVMPDRPLPRS